MENLLINIASNDFVKLQFVPLYRVIRNECRGFNNLSYTIHLRYEYMYFLFNRKILQGFVTYLTGALYMHPLWFYKLQHDNLVRSKLFIACQRWRFQWRFWFVPLVAGYLREEEEHKPDPWRNHIERNHMGLGWSGIRVAGFSLQHGYKSNPTTPKLQHTSNQGHNQCGNSTE